MRTKLGPVLSIEGLAFIVNLVDELKCILGEELARRAAKNKVSWDSIRSEIKYHRLELEAEAMRSWAKSPTIAPPREVMTMRIMVAKIMEQIRQRSK